MTPVSVHDVAAYILEQLDKVTAMKLQKLLYYSQAWSLVWDEQELFIESIEAWAYGPVVPEVYARHRGTFVITEWDGTPENLHPEQQQTIDAVVKHYGEIPDLILSDWTHQEAPWKEAREGLQPGERSNHTISLSSMHEYFSSLPKK